MEHAPMQPDSLIGRQFGNYVVTQKLGEGGMGSVYLAEHPTIGKKVALKVLHAEFASNEDVATRFFNEAKAVNDIQHPNIVDVVDYGVIQDAASGQSLVYFIMEFLAGVSLADLIRREAPMAPARALAICIQIADALSASHNRGIVHRDLKPDNVILIQRGRERDFVKVLDFGIAKLTGDQAGSRRTRTGIVMGTPAYMSPEQCEGRGNIDHRTDIYALGILLYEMITGRVPFTGEGYGEILVQHLTAIPQAPSTIRGLIPPHVEQIVMKALEKRPENRYPTMEEYMRAIADPVGYVESHGGLGGFMRTTLMPSQGGIAPISVVRPSPLLTPSPGTMAGVPGHHQQPTTLGASVGQVGDKPERSKVPLFAGLAVAVAAIGVGIFFLATGGDDKPTEVIAGTGSASGSIAASGSGSVPGSDTPGTGSASGSVAGSVAGSQTGSQAGSATGSATGSQAGSATGSQAGSATGSQTGSATGSAVDPAPVKVTINLVTVPAGAEVYLGKETKPAGKTPFDLVVDKSDKPISVTYKLKNYKDKKEQVTPNASSELETRLTKAKTTPPPGEDDPCKKNPNDPTSTLNPFCR
jgi:serine/threonine protein kinase